MSQDVTKRHETHQTWRAENRTGGGCYRPNRGIHMFWHDFGMLLHAYRQACAPSLLSCTIHSFRRAIGHRAHPMSSSGPRNCLSPVRAWKKESVFSAHRKIMLNVQPVFFPCQEGGHQTPFPVASFFLDRLINGEP